MLVGAEWHCAGEYTQAVWMIIFSVSLPVLCPESCHQWKANCNLITAYKWNLGYLTSQMYHKCFPAPHHHYRHFLLAISVTRSICICPIYTWHLSRWFSKIPHCRHCRDVKHCSPVLISSHWNPERRDLSKQITSSSIGKLEASKNVHSSKRTA